LNAATKDPNHHLSPVSRLTKIVRGDHPY